MAAPLIAHSWDACEYDIERLCVYITDDAAVANYFGIPRHRVEHVRQKMGKRVRYLRTGQDTTSEEPVSVSTQKAEADAQEGSNALLYAIERTGQKLAPELPKRKLTFDEQLALVASGRVGIVELR
jgi:hypothetical protein